MPIYNFKCSTCDYPFEEIISYEEQDIATQKHGKVVIECPNCKTETAEKENEIELTAKMGLTWADATWGSKK